MGQATGLPCSKITDQTSAANPPLASMAVLCLIDRFLLKE